MIEYNLLPDRAGANYRRFLLGLYDCNSCIFEGAMQPRLNPSFRSHMANNDSLRTSVPTEGRFDNRQYFANYMLLPKLAVISFDDCSFADVRSVRLARIKFVATYLQRASPDRNSSDLDQIERLNKIASCRPLDDTTKRHRGHVSNTLLDRTDYRDNSGKALARPRR